MKSTMPHPIRAELAERVATLLGPGVNLPALARELDGATGGIRTRSRQHVGAVTPEQARKALDIANAVRDYRPDLVLRTADADSPVYMSRWWLRREMASETEGQYGLYVHVFENDDPEGFHDHPWASASLLLDGGPVYDETPRGMSVIHNGDLFLRPATHRHRVRLSPDLSPGAGADARQGAVTLIATGRRSKPWGFERPDGSIEQVASRPGDGGEPLPRR